MMLIHQLVLFRLLSLLLLLSLSKLSDGSLLDANGTTIEYCRDRTNDLPVSSFRLTTCASCYQYLFNFDETPKELIAEGEWLSNLNGSIRVLADVNSEESSTQVCSTLNPNDCLRWRSCCLEAEACCKHQLEKIKARQIPPTTNNGKPFCPQTWDGFGCWDYSTPGQVVSGSCPEYIEHAYPTENSYKQCTINGTWFIHPKSDMEWTDYSSCINLENVKRSTITSIVCNIVSLSALVPSVFIFVHYRLLRTQNRIQLHINLFLSFILYGIVTLLWDIFIVLDRIESTSSSTTTIVQNSGGCKLLNVLTRYSRMANFMWMFCEAVFLHRLLIKAFEPPKNLIAFYLAGWVFPWVPVTAYAVLRYFYANKNCWVMAFGYWEWMIYVPNLVALLINLIVLFDVLRILVTQVQCHENELNSYRRALKATFILVPLFGLQLFLVIYRPPFNSWFGRHYEMAAAFVVNLQGLFVSLIFCLANGEVMSHLKKSWQRLKCRVGRREYVRSSSFSATTHTELLSLPKESRVTVSQATVAATGNHKRSNIRMTLLSERLNGGSNNEARWSVSEDNATNSNGAIHTVGFDLGPSDDTDKQQG